jgi:hypothetical protein
LTYDGTSVDAEIEQAWVEFRRWLADRLAGLDEADDELEVRAGAGGVQGLDFDLWDEGELHAEVVGVRTRVAEVRLRYAGWRAPDDGCDGWWRHAAVREVDHLAVLSVAVLREVLGVVHPAFLVAEGWTVEAPAEDDDEGAEEQDEEPPFVFPEGIAELRELVDRALVPVLGEEIEHDEDDDVPVRAGRSMVFVRVANDRPAVDLYAHVVLDVPAGERLAVELNVLNRGERDYRFYEVEGRVVMRRRLEAFPLVGAQLRRALEEMLGRVDDVARDLVARVGGRRFLDEPEANVAGEAELGVLLELMYADGLRPAAMARLFGDDLEALVRTMAAVKAGELDCEGHDPDVVLGQLGRALRHVLDVERPAKRLPPKPRSQQLALMDLPDEQPAFGLDDAS